jgi:hypothetical protein
MTYLARDLPCIERKRQVSTPDTSGRSSFRPFLAAYFEPCRVWCLPHDPSRNNLSTTGTSQRGGVNQR